MIIFQVLQDLLVSHSAEWKAQERYSPNAQKVFDNKISGIHVLLWIFFKKQVFPLNTNLWKSSWISSCHSTSGLRSFNNFFMRHPLARAAQSWKNVRKIAVVQIEIALRIVEISWRTPDLLPSIFRFERIYVKWSEIVTYVVHIVACSSSQFCK